MTVIIRAGSSMGFPRLRRSWSEGFGRIEAVQRSLSITIGQHFWRAVEMIEYPLFTWGG